MFYINQNSNHFVIAKQVHYENLRFIIKKKILGKQFKDPHPLGLIIRVNKINNLNGAICSFLNNEVNLRNILIGEPNVLETIKQSFNSPTEIETINKLFNYDGFIDKNLKSTFSFYNAYHLAENLGISTCVYCNRLYTNTIISKSSKFISRPTFDHWYPKADYPILSLSFYNLIPSCNICNSTIKGSKKFKLISQFHPYYDHPKQNKKLNFSFTYDVTKNNKANCKLKPFNDFTKSSLKEMKISELYQAHNEEINELIQLRKSYSGSFIESLQNILNINLTKEELYRYLFGVYFEDENLINRPLSKLKKDILTELNFI